MNIRWRRWVKAEADVEGVRFEALVLPGFSPCHADIIRTKAEAEAGKRWTAVFEECAPVQLKVHPAAMVMREVLARLDEGADEVGTEEIGQ